MLSCRLGERRRPNPCGVWALESAHRMDALITALHSNAARGNDERRYVRTRRKLRRPGKQVDDPAHITYAHLCTRNEACVARVAL